MTSSPTSGPPATQRLRHGLFLATAVASAYTAALQVVFARDVGPVFAWPMPPLSAATLGVLSAAGAVMAWLCTGATAWTSVRAAVPPVLLVLVAVPAVAVREAGGTNLSGGPVVGFVTAWLWLLVHAGLILGAAVGLAAQRRERGPVPGPVGRMPRPLAVPLQVLAASLTLAGLALLARPRAAGWWPWPVGPVDAGVLGVWLLALAAGTVLAVREADLWRTTPSLAALAVAGWGAVLAVATFPDAVRGGAGTALYLALAAALGVVGTGGLLAGGPLTMRRR